MRCPGRPSLRTIPPRRFLAGVRPARPRPSHSVVALAVFRFADAMRHCLTCERVACGFAIHWRRMDAAAKRLQRRSTCLWSLVQAPIGETDRSRSRATRHIKRHRFAILRCLSRVMHRRVPWRGVPLPSGSSLRGLVGRLVLPSCSPGGALGVHTLRRFAPAHGWPVISDRPGLRAVRVHAIRPIGFRRADFTARGKRMRANDRAANPG
jgi:hypothetical protein